MHILAGFMSGQCKKTLKACFNIHISATFIFQNLNNNNNNNDDLKVI